MWNKFLKQLSLPESYVSITLGFLVVIVAGLLIYNNFLKGKVQIPGVMETTLETKQEEQAAELPTKHKVVKGENLWKIAEKYYNSGYNWVTIAAENKLAHPNLVEADQELTIPQAETIKPVSGKIMASATEAPKTYTVAKGDNLWGIALKEYRDGYAWVRIARANNLVNPNLIHVGNVLNLP